VISVIELSNRGNRHAAFNASLLQTIAQACPREELEFRADPSHLECVGQTPCPTRPIQLSTDHPDRLELVTLRRIADDFRTLQRAAAGPGRRVLVVSSASASAIVAADLLRRLPGHGEIFVQLPMHGQLGAIRGGWRTRNPAMRALDLRASLQRCRGARFRYLVLEESIRAALLREVPGLDGAVDVLPHPVAEDARKAAGASIVPGAPLRIGMLGVASPAKGLEVFARLARRMREAAPGAMTFHLVGRVAPGVDPGMLDAIEGPLTADDLPREAYLARLAALHYVCLPGQDGYYAFSASGTLLDAIAARRPLIMLRNRMSSGVIEGFGDIGYPCTDEAEMLDALRSIARSPSPARHAAQVAAVDALASARTPPALAAQWRASLHGFLDSAAASRVGSTEAIAT
jgi:hypothetical protein